MDTTGKSPQNLQARLSLNSRSEPMTQTIASGICQKCTHPLDDHVVAKDGFHPPCLPCERSKGVCRRHSAWRER
jgi:hypothetical protein